jgi:hypothetical protein
MDGNLSRRKEKHLWAKKVERMQAEKKAMLKKC